MCFSDLAIENYCSSALPSTTQGIVPTTYTATVGSSVSYTCALGYAGSPSSNCIEYNSTVGVWSNVSGNCTSMSFYYYYTSMYYTYRYLRYCIQYMCTSRLVVM